MANRTCKDCLHYKVCDYWCLVLDPAHDGVPCDDFQSATDVVEVVRCKDCKHYRTSLYFPNEKICKLSNLFHSEDFFCASGERRNDETY